MMKRYIVKQYKGCNLDTNYVSRSLEDWLNDNPDYDLDKMTSSVNGSGFIEVVAVMKLRED